MRQILLELVNPSEGKDEALNQWYDQHHMREMLDSGRFLGARRYMKNPEHLDWHPHPSVLTWKYLTLYDIPEGADLKGFFRKSGKSAVSPELPNSGLVKPDFGAWIFSPISPRSRKADSGFGFLNVPRGLPAEEVGQSPKNHIFFALTNCVEGYDDQFNQFYNDYHAPECVAYLPGFVRAQRYRVSEEVLPGLPTPPLRYLALYEVDTPSAGDITKNVQASVKANPPTEGALTSDGRKLMDPEFVTDVYSPLAPYINKG